MNGWFSDFTEHTYQENQELIVSDKELVSRMLKEALQLNE